MADKFVVRQKKPDRKEDKSVVMTLRIDRELQEEFDKLSAKSDRSAMNLCAWLCAMRWNIWNLSRKPENKSPRLFPCPKKRPFSRNGRRAAVIIAPPVFPRQSYR